MAESALTRIGIVTVSDRASRGEYEDRSGPAVNAYLEEVLIGPWQAIPVIVPDDAQTIYDAIVRLCDREECCLVITTGGTGPDPRDVTPEATKRAIDKVLPGFGERMRAVSVDKVATAILSRQTAGIRGRALILSLPGHPRAIAECLDAVFAAIPDCIEVIGGPRLTTNTTRFVAYRPPAEP